MNTGGRYDLPVSETRLVVGEFIEKCGLLATEADSVVQEIESLHGIIERLSRDHYCFSHNTLQEYFSACRIVATREEIHVVQERHAQESWEPVIEFISAIMDDPYPVFQLLMKASEVKGLSNYPAMAKRTKVLSLLYKCLGSSPLLGKAQRAEVINHILQSHYAMATIYGAGGVYPFAMLRDEGVAHTYLWINKRPTLAEALKPFRRLSNLIYLNPMPEYAEAVIKCVDAQRWKVGLDDKFGAGIGGMIRNNLTVSLLVPVAKVFPGEVTARLRAVIDQSSNGFVKNAVGETIRRINVKHAS